MKRIVTTLVALFKFAFKLLLFLLKLQYYKLILSVRAFFLKRSIKKTLLSQGMPEEISEEFAQMYAKNAKETFKSLTKLAKKLSL